MNKFCQKLAFCALLCVGPVWCQVKIVKLKDPVPLSWVNFAISYNGKAMAANYGGEIYRWTAAGGFVDLGPGDPYNSSIGISADGKTIVGGIVGSDGNSAPAMWQEATGWVNLGHPAEGCVMDGNWGDAWGVNHDGSIVVGLAWYCPGAEGFEWTSQTGIVGLGHPQGASSRATGISANGSTIVGFWEDPIQGNRQPVRWVSGGAENLFLGNIMGEAIAASSNGNQIVGQAADSTGNGRAFYYTETGGLVDLGVLSGNKVDQSVAFGIADDGIVIGSSTNPFSWTSKPFVWTKKFGMQPLQKALVHHGAVIPSGVALTNVLAISGNGSAMVGMWQDANQHAGTWLAYVAPKTFTK
jgi:probable HAF family extracellular repeat protein